MSVFIKSLELASPLLLLTLLGYGLKKGRMLDDDSCIAISRLVINLILPVNIFVSIYDSDFKSSFNLKMILFIVISNFAVIVLMVILAHMLTKDKKKLGALCQAGVRGNYSIFGLPLAISIYGNKVAGPMAIAIAVLTAIYNVYSIGVFEHYEDGNISLGKQIINVLKTPIMIATVIGVAINLLNISIPNFLYQTLSYISKSITAISLINLGSSFNFRINKNLIKYVVIILVFKLLFLPLVSLPAAVAIGLRNTELVVVLVTATVPIATSAFSTAVCYNTDIELTSSAVVYSYIVCGLTIPIFLSALFSMGLI